MKYWLMAAQIHTGDINAPLVGQQRPYEKISLDQRLYAGDFVYLYMGSAGVFGWGYIDKVESYEDHDLGKRLRVTVTSQVARTNVINESTATSEPALAGVFGFRDGNLVFLALDQVRALNRLIARENLTPPPDPSSIDPDSLYEIQRSGRKRHVPKFVESEVCVFEETRPIEFKMIEGRSATKSIKSVAGDYAIALLNDHGGRVFWGIRNDGVVVGIKVNRTERDDIKQVVNGHIAKIQPPSPLGEFILEFHQVNDADGTAVSDLYVFEMDAPRGSPTELYANASNEVWLKTDSGKQKLTHVQILAEHSRRKGH